MAEPVRIAESLQYPIHEAAPTPEDLQLLRVADVCSITNYSKATVHRMIRAGDLPSVSRGRNVRVPLLGLRRWIAANSSQSSQTQAVV